MKKFCAVFGNIHPCECKPNYYWDGSVCGTAQTQTASCTGLPDNAEWNTVDSRKYKLLSVKIHCKARS